MIKYILGNSGTDKTFLAMNKFGILDNVIYMSIFLDEEHKEYLAKNKIKIIDINQNTKAQDIKNKSFLNFSYDFRNSFNTKEDFLNYFYDFLKQISNHYQHIFLDEFQAFCSSDLLDMIIKNKEEKNFYIIHQFSGQIDKSSFSKIWQNSKKVIFK